MADEECLFICVQCSKGCSSLEELTTHNLEHEQGEHVSNPVQSPDQLVASTSTASTEVLTIGGYGNRQSPRESLTNGTYSHSTGHARSIDRSKYSDRSLKESFLKRPSPSGKDGRLEDPVKQKVPRVGYKEWHSQQTKEKLDRHRMPYQFSPDSITTSSFGKKAATIDISQYPKTMHLGRVLPPQRAIDQRFMGCHQDGGSAMYHAPYYYVPVDNHIHQGVSNRNHHNHKAHDSSNNEHLPVIASARSLREPLNASVHGFHHTQHRGEVSYFPTYAVDNRVHTHHHHHSGKHGQHIRYVHPSWPSYPPNHVPQYHHSSHNTSEKTSARRIAKEIYNDVLSKARESNSSVTVVSSSVSAHIEKSIPENFNSSIKTEPANCSDPPVNLSNISPTSRLVVEIKQEPTSPAGSTSHLEIDDVDSNVEERSSKSASIQENVFQFKVVKSEPGSNSNSCNVSVTSVNTNLTHLSNSSKVGHVSDNVVVLRNKSSVSTVLTNSPSTTIKVPRLRITDYADTGSSRYSDRINDIAVSHVSSLANGRVKKNGLLPKRFDAESEQVGREMMQSVIERVFDVINGRVENSSVKSSNATNPSDSADVSRKENEAYKVKCHNTSLSPSKDAARQMSQQLMSEKLASLCSNTAHAAPSAPISIPRDAAPNPSSVPLKIVMPTSCRSVMALPKHNQPRILVDVAKEVKASVMSVLACDICLRQFNSFHEMMSHRLADHPNISQKPGYQRALVPKLYVCRFCQSVLSSHVELENHARVCKLGVGPQVVQPSTAYIAATFQPAVSVPQPEQLQHKKSQRKKSNAIQSDDNTDADSKPLESSKEKQSSGYQSDEEEEDEGVDNNEEVMDEEELLSDNVLSDDADISSLLLFTCERCSFRCETEEKLDDHRKTHDNDRYNFRRRNGIAISQTSNGDTSSDESVSNGDCLTYP